MIALHPEAIALRSALLFAYDFIASLEPESREYAFSAS